MSNIWRRADRAFDEKEPDEELKRRDVGSIAELDAALRQYGSSLKQLRRSYDERAIAQSFLGQNINYEPNITRDEMLAYYREHLDEFERQGEEGLDRPLDERRTTEPLSFQEAQAEIRKRLRKERVKSEVQEFVANARELAPVWTIYDKGSMFSEIPQSLVWGIGEVLLPDANP